MEKRTWRYIGSVYACIVDTEYQSLNEALEACRANVRFGSPLDKLENREGPVDPVKYRETGIYMKEGEFPDPNTGYAHHVLHDKDTKYPVIYLEDATNKLWKIKHGPKSKRSRKVSRRS